MTLSSNPTTQGASPLLRGSRLFRPGVQVYVNRSDEAFSEYMGISHRHDFLEIVQVVSGHGLHRVGEREFLTTPGDLFIINHNVPHGFFPPTPDEPLDLVVYNCVFKPSFLDASLLGADQFAEIAQSYLFRSLFPASVQPDADIRLSGTELETFGSLFETMHREYREQKLGYVEVIRANLILLLLRMFRLLSDSAVTASLDGTDQDSDQPMPIGSPCTAEPGQLASAADQAMPAPGLTASTEALHRDIVHKAMAYMKTHATQDLRLEEVAMQSFVSKHHFSRLFHEVTGVRFSEHVQQLRIEEAIRLLQSGQDKVADVALACGFHDLKHFYAIFRRHTGRTPGDFRRRG